MTLTMDLGSFFFLLIHNGATRDIHVPFSCLSCRLSQRNTKTEKKANSSPYSVFDPHFLQA